MADLTAVVIEDDPDIRELVRLILTQSGFTVVTAADGPAGLEAVREHEPVLTTLDVSMPGMDGFAVATRLREFSQTYIIMLTGQADEIDVIQGLQSGADDYLVKPFRPRELRVRVEAMLRRPRAYVAERTEPTGEPGADQGARREPAAAVIAEGALPGIPAAPQPRERVEPVATPEPVVEAQPAPVETPAPEPVTAGPAAAAPGVAPGEQLEWFGLTANVATRVATADGRGLELTRSEFDLLAALLRTGRRVRSKADLVLALRGEDYVTTYYVTDADKRAIEVHMANLRRKIGDSSATPRWIETVRGVGYRLAVD